MSIKKINKPVQLQIAQAIKYFKSQFPNQYSQFKQLCQGQKRFQKQLNAIQYLFTDPIFITLRNRVLDELLIKLRFIALNQTYLYKFETFLLQKFIGFCVTSLGSLFNLDQIYSHADNQPTNLCHQKERVQVFERYSILSQSLISILKFCFNAAKEKDQNDQKPLKFVNQMLKFDQKRSLQIAYKNFVKFVLITLSQKLQQIFKYNILDIKSIYPQFFSVLMDGFLHFKGGSKCLQMTSAILIQLMHKNKDNIWIQSTQMQLGAFVKLKNINRNINRILKMDILKKEDLQAQKQNQKVNEPQTDSFQKTCKQRLLLGLQSLITKFGYQNKVQQGVKFEFLAQNQTTQYINGSSKILKFIQGTINIMENQCIQTQNNIIALKNFNSVDKRILNSLILLQIQFSQQNGVQTSKSQPQSLFHKILFSKGNIQNSDIQFIKSNLRQIFIKKLKRLVNKNKTISSQKTNLLRQLKKIVKFVDFQKVQFDQFEYELCHSLKQLFKPNQDELNRPLIIVQESNGTLGSSIIAQSIPLVDLKPTDSFSTYHVGLQALQQSLRFQQARYILDQVRLFNWFQGQQVNLKYFRQLLLSFDLKSKINLLEYFLNEIIRMKMQETAQLYGLQMSLVKFYKILVNFFYIDCLLNQENGLLNYQSFSLNVELFERTFMPKLTTLYNILIQNRDIKRLLISSKEQQLLVFWNLRIICAINKFMLFLQGQKPNSKMRTNYAKTIIAQNLILNKSHQTYLLKLITTFYLLQFAAPLTIGQALAPIQSTLIHRNAGNSLNNKYCNLQFIGSLIQICHLKQKQAQQLAQIYLSKDFIVTKQANQVISLIFTKLKTQTMRKCILSTKFWYAIFSKKSNLQALNNKQMKQQDKQQLFHSNDGDNVTISNALGVIALQIGDKWTVQLQFKNPRKQILIDAMINLIQVNNRLIFWKRFFFENVLVRINQILIQIAKFNNQSRNKNKNQDENQFTVINDRKQGSKRQYDNSRRQNLYERIKNKLFKILKQIPLQYYKYSTQINSKIRENLHILKVQVQKQHSSLKRQCFVNQRYDKYLQPYKKSNQILQKIDTALNYNQNDQNKGTTQ